MSGFLLILSGLFAECDKPLRICDAVKGMIEAGIQSTKSLCVNGVYATWQGGFVITASRQVSSGCSVWVEAPDHPQLIEETIARRMRGSLKDKLGTSWFEVTLSGRLERQVHFNKATTAPYIGNGYGRNGSYEYRFVVDRWVRVRPLQKRN